MVVRVELQNVKMKVLKWDGDDKSYPSSYLRKIYLSVGEKIEMESQGKMTSNEVVERKEGTMGKGELKLLWY